MNPSCENVANQDSCLLHRLESGSCDSTVRCEHCLVTVADLEAQVDRLRIALRTPADVAEQSETGCERAVARAVAAFGEQPMSTTVLDPKIDAGGVDAPIDAEAFDAVLPGYEVHELIGRGGMGAVYRARELELNRDVAVKLLLTRSADKLERLAARFAREAEITARLDHPSIVPVFSSGFDSEGRCYYTMRLVRGREVKEVIRLAAEEAEGWNRSRAIAVLVKICQAMAFAHERGVVHRDLKPANVMVGDLGEVYVMDWGLARMHGQTDVRDIRIRTGDSEGPSPVEQPGKPSNDLLMTMDGAVIGTPAYMPPEQARGEVDQVDHLSDIYALGAILYQLLTGRAPYLPPDGKSSPIKLLTAVIDGPPEPVGSLSPDTPDELNAICEKAMAREREQRYQSALDMAEDLQAFLDDRVVKAYRTGALVEARKWVTRNRSIALLSMLAILLAVMGFATVSIVQFRSNRDLLEANGEKQRALNAELQTSEKLGDVNTDLQEANATITQALQRADDASDRALLRTYVAEINLASVAAQTPDGIARAVELVNHWESVPPISDQRRAIDPRGWEWFYLKSLGNSAVRTIETGHKGYCIAWSPDGKRLAHGCGSRDAGVYILEGASPERLRRIAVVNHARGYVTACDWSPDGSRLASGGHDGAVRVWDTGDWSQHRVIDGKYRRDALRWHPDGDHLAVGDVSGAVEIRSVEDGALIASVKASGFKDLTWSPDGKQIAIACVHGVVLADAASGQVLRTLANIGKRAHSVAWNGDLIAYGQSDGHVSRWEASSGTHLSTETIHIKDVSLLRFSPDGSQLASSGDQGVIHVSPRSGGKPLFSFAGHMDEIKGLSWSPDGRTIASTGTDDTVRLWQLVARQQNLPADGKKVDSLAWNPAGTLVATTNSSHGVIISDPRTKRIQQWIDQDADFVAWSPDGRRIVFAEFDRGDLTVWDIEKKAQVGRLPRPESNLDLVSWSPGTQIVATFRSGFRVWDATTFAEVFAKTNRRRLGCAASPDGRRLATTTEVELEIWRTDTWQRTAHPIEGDAEDDAVCWSPDGTQIALATESGIGVIDVESGARLMTLRGHTGEVKSIAWHPTEPRLASGSNDHSIRIWCLRTGSEVLSLHDHSDPVNCVAWSPDGMSLVSGSDDETVLIRDLAETYQGFRTRSVFRTQSD